VVMLSARAGEEARLEGLQSGADEYLVKPFSARELIARVNSQLTLAKHARERESLLERERIARRSAESANRAKDEFLAMLGHELRNPLAPIQTALQLMRLRGQDTAERERMVIERQVTHLTRLVDDLLDVSRITRGRVDLDRRPIEIAEVVARAIEVASPLLEQRKHTLDVHVPRRGLMVDGDAFRLAQVVANLLTNAAKYTESGGRITVHGDRADDDIVVRVRDTGIGISREMLPRVFDLFVQERQALDRSHGGLGLGLTIVRNLVALHDGSVTVNSEGLGRGSEFIIRLPAASGIADAPRPHTLVRRPEAGAVNISGLRVLVVDDNEDAADMLVYALASKGHQARMANDGPAALRICEEFQPSVAVLDIGLPVMDGYELAGRLREISGMEHLRLIAVTGYGQEADQRRTRAAGFDQHLVKPIDLEALESALAG
jgi:signal transduction histidine kinase